MFAAALRPAGATPSQGEALRLLETEGGLSLSELGDLLVCGTGSSRSRLVDRLVTRGLVRRLPDASDRCCVRLELTADGRRGARGVALAKEALHEKLRRLIGDEPITPALRVLRTLADGFPAGAAPAPTEMPIYGEAPM